MRLLKEHALVIGVALLGALTFALYTWAEYGFFCDQGRDHGNQGCEGFWSNAHLHDWIYNAASNWQSELWFGVLIVILLRKLQTGNEDEAE